MNITDPNKIPYFFSVPPVGGSPNVTGDGTVFTIPAASLLQGSGFNLATSVYTPEVGGKFIFGAKVYLANLTTSHTKCLLNFVSTQGTYTLDEGNPGSNRTQAFTFIMRGDLCEIPMAQGDTGYFTIAVYNGTKVVNVSGVIYGGRTQ